MKKELEDLSTTLLSIYQKNLQFLKENYEDIFNRVDTLSNDISNNKYNEKYSLEYKDGYFDILNINDNTSYYNTDSYDDADSRANKCDFTQNGSFNLLRTIGDSKYLSYNESFDDVKPLINFINENVDLRNIEFNKIFKMVFFNTGLAIHINEINKKLNPLTTLIIESNLEIFRLSLFITDYSEFNKGDKKLFLSIDDDFNNRQNIYSQFYNYHVYMNYNIKNISLIEESNIYHNEMTSFFSNNFAGHFPYKLVLENIKRTKKFIDNDEYFIDTIKMHEANILKNKNVLVIAAGPSLDNYIEFIKKYQNKFIIICVDVIVKKLEINNIKPNIVVSIDPSNLCADYLTCKDESYLDDSLIVFLSQQHEDTIKVVKGKNYIFSQSINFINEIGTLGSVNNVGTFSFKLAVHFGAKKIFTIGNDCAFNQETGSRYAKDSSCIINDDIIIKNNDSISKDDVIEVKGNLQDIVKTNRDLYNFKSTFESTSHELNAHYKNINVYNLSNGVYINNFEPMSYDKMNELSEKFDEISFDANEEKLKIAIQLETKNYENDIAILTKIINKVNKSKKQSFKNKNMFLENKLELMVHILEQNKTMSSVVYGDMFLIYTELVDIYMNFLLNLKEKDLYTSKNLQKLNVIWSNGVINVLKQMKDIIK